MLCGWSTRVVSTASRATVVGSFRSTWTFGEDAIAEGSPFYCASTQDRTNAIGLGEPLRQLLCGELHQVHDTRAARESSAYAIGYRACWAWRDANRDQPYHSGVLNAEAEDVLVYQGDL